MEIPQEDKQSFARKKLAEMFVSLNKSRLADIDDGGDGIWWFPMILISHEQCSDLVLKDIPSIGDALGIGDEEFEAFNS